METNRELILTNTEPLSTGSYKYTLIVPEKDGQFIFDPAEYLYEHGTVVFKCFGSVVTDKQCLAQGSKIYYEQGSAEDGYWLPAEENYIVVSSEEETRKQLEEIHFVEMLQVSVNLKQPDFGGKINYYVEGKKIYTSEYETYSGTVITMDFEPWEGWICSQKDGVEYIVGATDSYREGEDLARQQLSQAELLIKKEFTSNQNFYLNAQEAAISTIETLVKQLNPEVDNLVVDVEFY